MKRSLVISLLLVLAIAPFSATYAKDDKSSKNSSKASVGTKELLARIEALEAAIVALSGNDNTVGGHEYRIVNFGAGLAEFVPNPGQFHLLANSSRYLQFNTDGTGNRVTDSCESQQLNAIPPNQPTLFASGPGCVNIDGPFTWTQIGNDLEVSTGTGSVIMTVSDSGDTLINIGFGFFGTGNPFNLAAGSITVGVRLSN